MQTKVLVAYASKYGATEEIAERIGLKLSQAGYQVDVLPVNEAVNLNSYEGIVVGSAVYVGQWRKQAGKFLKKNKKILSTKKVWIFSSGPTGKGNPNDLMKGWNFPLRLQHVVSVIKPRDITLFHGQLNPDKMNLIERFVINKIKAAIGDFRDWEAIENWGEAIAKQLNTAQ